MLDADSSFVTFASFLAASIISVASFLAAASIAASLYVSLDFCGILALFNFAIAFSLSEFI